MENKFLIIFFRKFDNIYLNIMIYYKKIDYNYIK